MLYRSHLRPPSNNLSRAFGLSLLLSAHQRRRRWRIWLLGEKDREREKETKAGGGGEEREKKEEEDDENGRDPLAPFARSGQGTREEKDGMFSPRCTSVHRRTEGHGVYFCRVAAAVAGQKACGFHPRPPSHLYLSLSTFLSLRPLFSRISLSVSHTDSLSRSLARRRRRRCRLPLSLYSFATAVLLTLFSLLATPLFMPPHSPGLRPCLAFASRRLSFSSFLSIILPPAPELNHLRRFFADTACRPSSSSMCKPIAHASKRAGRSEP